MEYFRFQMVSLVSHVVGGLRVGVASSWHGPLNELGLPKARLLHELVPHLKCPSEERSYKCVSPSSPTFTPTSPLWKRSWKISPVKAQTPSSIWAIACPVRCGRRRR